MFYTYEELEKLAENINKKYFPDRLTALVPLDPYDLLEALGCEVEWKYISPDDSILGITFFDDGVWYIWPDGAFKEGDECVSEFFPRGTIVVNQCLTETRKKTARASEGFVIVHECAHWIKDQDYFRNQSEVGISQICKKNDFTSTFWNSGMGELQIIERQTNYLAAAILMPRSVIVPEFFKSMRYKNIPSKPLKLKEFMKSHINTLAKKFGVNYNPLLYRLQDLGVIER